MRDTPFAPSQTVPYTEAYMNATGVVIIAQLGWAANQNGCQAAKVYILSPTACGDAYNLIDLDCSTSDGTQYGGGWIDDDTC